MKAPVKRGPLPIRYHAPPRGRNRRGRAFTLLELLIAVSAFAVVLIAIHGVFFGAVRLRGRTEATVEQAGPVELAVARLRRDLQNLVPPGGTFFGPLQSEGQRTNAGPDLLVGLGARRVSPDFYTASGIVDAFHPWGDVQVVAYGLMNPTNRSEGWELVRAVTRNLLAPRPEPPELEFLLDRVEEVRFEYFDGSQWLPTWDSTLQPQVLPLAIRVRIARLPDRQTGIEPAPLEMVVPVWVRPLTNNVTAAEAQGA
ncbi:type II secretion system protein GspJ [Limisphaera sp. 4302-co]|uniref:type II secretion system protein GspJ n=1 Tax=Limisphaera sp. 4302-co TaxID=3400417 RepID=UPI003C149276